jgi:hypothetical protein
VGSVSAESAAAHRRLRRLRFAQWVAALLVVASSTALLVPMHTWIALLVVLGLGLGVGVGALVATLLLDRRIIALGGASLFARGGGSTGSSDRHDH